MTLATVPELPPFVTPASSIKLHAVGINKDGEFYLYGDSPASPGPVVPAIAGRIISLSVHQYGGSSRYGLRDYLDLIVISDVPTHRAVLRLPCSGSQHRDTGVPHTPWSVRSLLGALAMLDLTATSVKLQPKRGREATFIQVFPRDSYGDETELRAEPIGPSRDDLEIAVNRLQQALHLQPQFVIPDVRPPEPLAP
jgi:hypothetical protein